MDFARYVLGIPARKLRKFINSMAISKAESLAERFTLVYRRNVWGSNESVSGNGSTLKMTGSIRAALPLIFKEFQIESLFDAPCGDFHWMQHVNLDGVSYVGGDIVEPLVTDISNRFSSSAVSFIHIDITNTTFPQSDLVLNRDILFHLAYADIAAVLKNFLESNSKYLLSTSHSNDRNFLNSDIRSGDFRLIDLFLDPFKFPKDFLYQVSEPSEGTLPPRSLFLWNREQVKVAYSNLAAFLSKT